MELLFLCIYLEGVWLKDVRGRAKRIVEQVEMGGAIEGGSGMGRSEGSCFFRLPGFLRSQMC